MPRPLLDLSALDLSRETIGQEELRRLVPHRGQFQMLDGVCHYDPEAGMLVAWKDWGREPWWAPGHVPGRPLMPGVLMIEGAAQAATVLIKKTIGWQEGRFIGLGGLDGVRFRGQVVPPARVHFVAGPGHVSGNRLAKYLAQAHCNGRLVMEMELLGVLL